MVSVQADEGGFDRWPAHALRHLLTAVSHQPACEVGLAGRDHRGAHLLLSSRDKGDILDGGFAIGVRSGVAPPVWVDLDLDVLAPSPLDKAIGAGSDRLDRVLIRRLL